MESKVGFARYQEEIVIASTVALCAFTLFGLQLWMTFPYNCGPDECSRSIESINQHRIELLLAFGPFIVVILAIGLVFVVRDFRGKHTPFSSAGIIALAWPGISFVGFILNPYWGFLSALAGLIIVIILIVGPGMLGLVVKKPVPFHWKDLAPILWNLIWCSTSYLMFVRFLEVFGD